MSALSAHSAVKGSHNDVNDMVNELTDTLTLMYNECFPLIKVKISSRDPPFMSPLIKHLCNLRNKSMKRYGFLIDTMLQPDKRESSS